MGVTVADIKADIKDYNYKTLTGGDDTKAQRAIDKATIWAKAKVIAAGRSFDDSTDINKLIVLKRAEYELYASAENENVATDKKEDALELLRAAYGNAVDSAGYSSASDRTPIATGVVIKNEKNADRS